MKRTIQIILMFMVMLLFSGTGQAQKTILSIANKQFGERQYINAREKYQILIDQLYQNPDLYRNLADSYYLNGQLAQAAQWYKEFISYYPDQVEPEYYFRYALSLKANEDYKTADNYMDKLLATKSDDIRAIIFDKKRDYLEQIKYQSGRYKINNIPINSTYTDFGTTFYNGQFVFSSSRDTLLLSKTTDRWTEESFLKIHKVKYEEASGEFSEPKVFDHKLDTKFHESTPVFSKDGNTIYFTGNRKDKKKKEMGTLKIYRSYKMENGDWSPPEDLPFNSESYSSAHPFLSEDEKILYFSSDMPGGYGQSDIYKVTINEGGQFGTPINLIQINTEGKETFPFIGDEGKLYFASNGYPGLGGLDIFVTDVNLNSDEITNLGKPINSSMDDYAFYIDAKTRKGFFSSNRNGGKGSDDIYGFTELRRVKKYISKYMTGYIRDKDTNEPLKGATVSLYDKENKLIGKYKVNDSGKYYISNSKLKKVYSIKVEKKRYATYTLKNVNKPFPDISINNFELTEDLLSRKPFEFTVLADPSHFDMESNTILEKSKKQLDAITSLLKKYERVDTYIKSYAKKNTTGAKIAQQQSEMVKEYLNKNGISTDRMIVSGITTEKTIREDKMQLRVLVQQPVIFDYNSYKLKLKIKQGITNIIEVLRSYPDLRMEVQTYTDSRASRQFNKELSIKRMNVIMDYILKEGDINRKQLRGRAFGETRLLNGCTDNIPCSEEEHAENRRVEFVIY